MQNGQYRDRFGSTGNRESYLYDGLGFDVMAQGTDNMNTTVSNGWNSHSTGSFNPTIETLRTNGRVVVRTSADDDDDSLLYSFYDDDLDKTYYTQDSLGSVIGIFDDDGEMEERYNYGSFGQLIEGSFDEDNRLGYFSLSLLIIPLKHTLRIQLAHTAFTMGK